MNEELRRAERHALPPAIHVSDAMTGELVGRLVNISAGGSLLMARAPLLEDTLYQLRFALPVESGSGHESLELGAQVMWSEAGSTAGQYWSGLRFIGLGGEPARRLQAWLDRHRDAAGDAP